MPGPFPGMDPYLESVSLWRGVHQGIIFCANAAINHVLPDGFVASIDERVYIETPPHRSLYPDVAIQEFVPPSRGKSGTAAAVADAPRRVVLLREEMREPFIEIRSTRPDRELVTLIEVLSPINKAAGEGQKEYQRKQEAALRSGVSLLEIDLLRAGTHTVAVPERELRREGGAWDYLVSLHRGGQGAEWDYWPISLRERLPRVLVPLAEDTEDIVLDLQSIVDRCYDEGAYSKQVNYREYPVLSLTGADVKWMDALLREKGLRP